MSGTHIKVTYNDQGLKQVIKEVEKLSDFDRKALAVEIVGYLEESTRENFDYEETPEGLPWPALYLETIAAKRKREASQPAKALHGLTLHLRDTIFTAASATQAMLSTGPGTEKYAATHQFGDEDRGIEPRPYLGIGKRDESEILAVVADALKDASDLL